MDSPGREFLAALTPLGVAAPGLARGGAVGVPAGPVWPVAVRVVPGAPGAAGGRPRWLGVTAPWLSVGDGGGVVSRL